MKTAVSAAVAKRFFLADTIYFNINYKVMFLTFFVIILAIVSI
jgi:hypothetical protein